MQEEVETVESAVISGEVGKGDSRTTGPGLSGPEAEVC